MRKRNDFRVGSAHNQNSLKAQQQVSFSSFFSDVTASFSFVPLLFSFEFLSRAEEGFRFPAKGGSSRLGETRSEKWER